MHRYNAIAVSVRRLRRQGARNAERDLDAFITALPEVGRTMSLFAKKGRRSVATILTTPVRRILVGSSELVMFVETDNTVYRLAVTGVREPKGDWYLPERLERPLVLNGSAK